MEFDFLVKPYLDNFQQNPCQIPALQEVPAAASSEIKAEDKCANNLVALELKLPVLPSSRDVGDAENGFVTPTSGESKIPASLKCPPAPRKPKAMPSPARRKAMLGQMILLDLSKEIESLFPPELLADLGKKIKKVRQASDLMK